VSIESRQSISLKMEGNTDDYPIQTVKFERSSNSHVNFLIPLEFYEFVPKYSCTSQSTPDLSSSKFVEDMFLSRYSYVNELGESQNKVYLFSLMISFSKIS